MLMKDDKRKAVTMIMGKLKGETHPDNLKPKESEYMDKAPTNEMGDEMDASIGLDSAAEEMMSAMESKDAKAFSAALKSFLQMCETSEEE